ncbi:hypothetical protein N7486_005358 [Penicillium sp. IBT 16267x]|nr:hypothetical protein N7486_005358 [Penicillium sp. IBT 16267x]
MADQDSDANNSKKEGLNPEEEKKVHRKHLLPETLNAYNLPWEWDEGDSRYLIIKRWITEDFQEELFAHTKRIRKGKTLTEKDTIDNAGATLQDLMPNRNYDFEPSACCQCEANLSFDVSLKNSAVKQSVDELKAHTSHRNSSPRDSIIQKVDVISSRVPGYGKMVLYQAVTTEEKQNPQFSWIHAQSEMRSVDEFLKFASNVPDLTDEDRALVLTLMRKASLKIHDYGCSTTNDVLRCDGVDSTSFHEMTNEKSAILIRYPYNAVQKMKDVSQSPRGAGHHIRSLLQYSYNFQSTRKRDLEQVVQKMGLFPAGHVIHVPELWAVIVNFQYIITSATASLLEGTNFSYEITIPPAPRSSSSPSIICVLDPRKRLFSFPTERCKTFFALRHNIVEHCLPPKFKYSGYDFELLDTDGTAIKADDWSRITTTHAKTVVRVHVRLLSPGSTKVLTKRDGTVRKESLLEEKDETLAVGEDVPDGQENSREDHSDRALIRLVEQAHDAERHYLWQEKRRMQPVTSLSGLVVNKKPDDTPSSDSNIYFQPAATNAFSQNEVSVEGSQELNYGSSIQTEQIEDQPRPLDRSSTFGSLLADASTLPPPSPDHRTEISLDFPPVFTWPSGKKASVEKDTVSAEHLRSVMESRETSIAATHILNNDEETIRHVSSYINKQLLELGEETDQEIYKAATISSHFHADQVIRKQWATPLPTLLANSKQVGNASTLPPWEATLKESIVGLCRLFNFFVPMEFPCDVTKRFWGAIHDLVTIIPQICEISEMSELTDQTRRHRMTEAFFILDLKDAKYADLRCDVDRNKLTKDLEDCHKCANNWQYSTRKDALDHLSTHHFERSSDQKSPISHESLLVVDFGQYLTFVCRKDAQRILHQLQDFLASLEKMALQIQHGVSENGKFDRNTYRIPSSLVGAFQHLLMMVVTGAHMAKWIYDARKAYIDPDPVPSFLTHSERYQVTEFGAKAEALMKKAESDIVLMTHTGEISDVVTYETVSPSLVLALVMEDIRCRDSENNPVKLVDIYRSYMQNLQFKASQSPHRRLLQEIYLFQEELQMTKKIFYQQSDILLNYSHVIRPGSFRITTESRASSFGLEGMRLVKLVNEIEADVKEIEDLVDQIGSLATQTRNGVDVRQEDQGKTILVFTIVTVVFTPLSFVTSYLGMNTNDIRNMTSSQSLFWAVSVPLTVAIIATVLVVAFQVERLREALNVLFQSGHSPIEKPFSTTSNEGNDVDLSLKRQTGLNQWGDRLLRRRKLEERQIESDGMLKV